MLRLLAGEARGVEWQMEGATAGTGELSTKGDDSENQAVSSVPGPRRRKTWLPPLHRLATLLPEAVHLIFPLQRVHFMLLH